MHDIVIENVQRKHVKKALAKLLDKGEIVEFEGYFTLARVSEEETIPFAEILRRREICGTKTEAPASKEEKQKSNNIDDEIRRLEAELAEDNGDDDDHSGEEDSVNDNNLNEESMHDSVKKDETSSPICETEDILCLSTVAQDRIAPLPQSSLPKTKKRTLKGIDDEVQQKQQKKPKVNKGLRDAVKEVLSGYVARSHERLPFYCRVCAKQYTNEVEFFDHKKTDFHKVALDIERRASFCKLCRKQFTSPVQLKEHISSRPHKERLDQVKSRQSRQQSHGRGSTCTGLSEGRSQRQWC